MAGHRQSQQGPIHRSGNEQAVKEPRRHLPGTSDAHVIDEFGLAIARPGEWLPNFDDVFDLDFDE